MKTQLIKSSLLSAALIVGMTGCVTNPLVGNTPQNAEARHNTAKSTGIGAGIGCGVGAVLGYVVSKNLKTGCVAGAAVGAGVGFGIAYHRELKAMRDLAVELNSTPGTHAVVVTEAVEAKDASGKVKSEEKFSSLPVELDSRLVRAHSQDIANNLQRIARMSDASKTPVVIEVRGPEQDRRWIREELTANLKANTTVRITESFATDTKLVLSPIPDVGAAQ